MTPLPLEVYRIDMKYIRNLHNIDDRIFSVSPQIGKDERPFLGIIIICMNTNIVYPCQDLRKSMKKCVIKLISRKLYIMAL